MRDALGPRAEVHRYDRGYHMLLRDLDGPIVWDDVLDWVGRRDAAMRDKAAAP